MDFFNSLTLDLKLVLVAVVAVVLLALFSANKKNEKKYLVVLVLLAAVGVYRYVHINNIALAQVSTVDNPQAPKPAYHVPLVSTSSK